MSIDRHQTADRPDDLGQGAGVPESVSDVGDTDPTADTNATWDPRQAAPFDETGFGDVAPAEPSGAPRRPEANAPGSDPDTTFVPAGSRGLEDIWRDDFDGMTPDMTLKGPGEAKPRARALRATDVPSNVSVEGYELLQVLGEGGVGVVYLAIQKSIGRKTAVKMIKPGIGQDAREKAKFVSEATVTGELDHPNIVPIHDLGQTVDGQPFYVMKMVKGTPWSGVIKDNSLAENLRILLDVCDAVSFAHSKGVIHRDLKPDNVMLGEFGEVQLMDWGLGASVADEGKATSLTRSQAAGGTPAYMAPEMVTGRDGPVGVHSDVYLLGAILYEIITGKPPHAGQRVMDCLENAHHNVIRPTEHTGVLVDIALNAMQTDPADRYPSVKCLKEALLDYQSHAESINLCQRSLNDLRRAGDNRDYEGFAQALFGFREALKLWEENVDAKAGVEETQLQYARCAYEKGDLDLAASTLEPGCAAHRSLLAEIGKGRQKRASAKRRLRFLRVTAMSLTAAVILILTVASIWISAAERQAVAAKEAAIVAQEAEAEQRKLAEVAKTKAQEEEARAVKALGDLEKAVQALVAAQTQEERALAKARAAELVAVQTQDELARTGMLLDNSWWVFDAAAAKRKQSHAAVAIGMPVELTLALPNDVELEMVLIPPGEFVMGSPPKEEKRAADEYLHRVRHSRAFYMAKFELTEAQWQALTGRAATRAGGAQPGAAEARGRDADPGMATAGGMATLAWPWHASFEQITAELLPALQGHAPDGYQFRLPSEAEWEYACRAGTSTAYHTGDGPDALDATGWFLFNSDRTVRPVGGKTPNAFGLYDVHGNVGEICTDQYVAAFYLESPSEDPISTRAGERPVVRGGSVLNTPEHCRSAYRSYVFSRNQYEFVGLRLALVPIRDEAALADPDRIGAGVTRNTGGQAADMQRASLRSPTTQAAAAPRSRPRHSAGPPAVPGTR